MFTGTCIICGKAVKPKKAKSKIAKTCSKVCMSKMLTGSNNPNYGNIYSNETRQKISMASKARWKDPKYRKKMSIIKSNNLKVKNACQKNSKIRAQSEEAKLKERQTNEKNGRWIPLNEKTEFQKYKRLVWSYTRHNIDITTLNEHENRGKAGIDGTYHLDHKFSLLACFKNNIPVEIAGSIHNLEFLPWKENNFKGAQCSITKKELYEQFNKAGEANIKRED